MRQERWQDRSQASAEGRQRSASVVLTQASIFQAQLDAQPRQQASEAQIEAARLLVG